MRRASSRSVPSAGVELCGRRPSALGPRHSLGWRCIARSCGRKCLVADRLVHLGITPRASWALCRGPSPRVRAVQRGAGVASGAVSVGVFPGCLVGAIRAAPMRGAWHGACRASRGGLSWLHLSHEAWRRQSNDRLCLLLITWAWARLWATSMRGAWGGCLTGLLWVPSRSKLMRGLGIWLGRGLGYLPARGAWQTPPWTRGCARWDGL